MSTDLSSLLLPGRAIDNMRTGAFGFMPIIDRKHNYYMQIVAADDDEGEECDWMLSTSESEDAASNLPILQDAPKQMKIGTMRHLHVFSFIFQSKIRRGGLLLIDLAECLDSVICKCSPKARHIFRKLSHRSEFFLHLLAVWCS